MSLGNLSVLVLEDVRAHSVKHSYRASGQGGAVPFGVNAVTTSFDLLGFQCIPKRSSISQRQLKARHSAGRVSWILQPRPGAHYGVSRYGRHGRLQINPDASIL